MEMRSAPPKRGSGPDVSFAQYDPRSRQPSADGEGHAWVAANPLVTGAARKAAAPPRTRPAPAGNPALEPHDCEIGPRPDSGANPLRGHAARAARGGGASVADHGEGEEAAARPRGGDITVVLPRGDRFLGVEFADGEIWGRLENGNPGRWVVLRAVSAAAPRALRALEARRAAVRAAVRAARAVRAVRALMTRRRTHRLDSRARLTYPRRREIASCP